MPKNITSYNLLISCPGDVTEEIQVINDVVDKFNDQFIDTLGIQIQTKFWKKSAYPQSGGKPQALLNAQFVTDCDAAVAVFWTRFGTPTDEYGSGTEEEIEIMLESGKQVFMYFSDQPKKPSEMDSAEYEKICKFREKYKDKGVYFTYTTCDEFKDLFYAHLTRYFLTEERVKKERENRSSALKLVGIDKDGNLSDNVWIGDFIPNVTYTLDRYREIMREYFTNISTIPVGVRPERISDNLPELYQFYKPIEIDEGEKKLIYAFANALGIKIDETFFGLGNLAKNSLASAFSGDDGIQGTEEEKKKYRNIRKLQKVISKFIDWRPIEHAFNDKKCVKMALQNNGTAVDDDIEITLKFPKESLIWINDFPQFDNEEKKYLLNDCNMTEMFRIPSSLNYLDYEDSQKGSNMAPYIPLADIPLSEHMHDYSDNYFEELQDVFCYSIYESGDFYILKLKIDYIKHHTAVAFPTVLFIREVFESIDYEISSRNLPDIIKGTLGVKTIL